MVRAEARLKRGIWRGLRGVPPHAKLLYAVVLTEPTLNHAGVCALRLDKWAEDAELSEAETEKAFESLLDGRFLFVDTSTREVLVRTLIRNDDVPDQPYLFKGALKEALLTESTDLRRVLASELRRLPPRKPDGVSKSGKAIVYPDPHAAADELDPDGPRGPGEGVETLSKGSPEGVETLSPKKGLDTLSKGMGVGEGVGEGVKGSVGTSSSSVGAAKRGTRIPDDFTVTDAMKAWARKTTPLVGKAETDLFVDYWQAETGARASKLDWVKAWQVWMRREQKTAERRPAHLRSVPTPPVELGTFEAFRVNAAGAEAAAVLRTPYLPRPQPPSDPTPSAQWIRDRAIDWIDAHEHELRAALTERRPTG